MRLRNVLLSATAALLLVTSSRAAAGDWRIGASAGVGVAFNRAYLTVGGLVGRELGLGFELVLKGDYWTANSPNMFKLAPGLTWHAPLPFRPYVGGYYAHWFVGSGLPDSDALGLRGGINLLSLGPVGLDVGVAWERRLSCSDQCSSWWPEATASISF